MYKLKYSFLLFIAFLFSGKIIGQSINNLSLDFVKTDYSKTKKEIIKGTIHYSPVKTVVDIYFPINQFFFFEDKIFRIYYPDEKKVLKFNTESKTFLTFFQLFLGVVQDDFNPSYLGYSLISENFENDTLIMEWGPPKEIEGEMGPLIMKMFKNNVTHINNYDAKGNVVNKIHYSDYRPFKMMDIPHKITVINGYQDIYKEEIIMSGMKSGNDVIYKINQFQIPKNVEEKEIFW